MSLLNGSVDGFQPHSLLVGRPVSGSRRARSPPTPRMRGGAGEHHSRPRPSALSADVS
ncbi:hypothetical protein [Streptomyces sediminimaris]|uniref:hypothetical protein n=1 Tax=Streptomyces sediminimaris TaxID=3383721 RepID=UPI00399B0C03